MDLAPGAILPWGNVAREPGHRALGKALQDLAARDRSIHERRSIPFVPSPRLDFIQRLENLCASELLHCTFFRAPPLLVIRAKEEDMPLVMELEQRLAYEVCELCPPLVREKHVTEVVSR